MALYRPALTVMLWPSSFLKKYGPMIPPAHKAHQTVSFSECEKDFNDDHREEITDFVQSIPGYQEDDEEDVDGMRCRRLWTVCVEESYLVDDKTDEDEDNNHNESSKGPSNADAFSALETAMKG
ncbi:hypothetical protein TNCV_1352861 [Trichonephila clavipes]|nr:hypothetical protein TNCV_1352861 [Trichonephila clavipes]